MTKHSIIATGLGWILVLAATATAAAAAATLLSQRRVQRRLAHQEHKSHLRSWENEGGNF